MAPAILAASRPALVAVEPARLTARALCCECGADLPALALPSGAVTVSCAACGLVTAYGPAPAANLAAYDAGRLAELAGRLAAEAVAEADGARRRALCSTVEARQGMADALAHVLGGKHG